jgi:carbon monoxide dehydrogenase subunit G
VLVTTIPGCERLEPAGPDSYRFTIAAGVASIQGTYTGEVSLSQLQEPSSFVLTARGAGGPGTVTTSVQVRLTPGADGTTELSYDADAAIGGLIAGVGQRMLASVARRTAGQFFSSVDEVLAGRLAIAASPGTPPLPGAPAAAQPAVYLAPARPAVATTTAAATTGQGFLRGVLIGAAVALAGVAVGAIVGRRTR